jgi:hypothetical protein
MTLKRVVTRRISSCWSLVLAWEVVGTKQSMESAALLEQCDLPELQCAGDPAPLLTAGPTATPVLTAYIGDSIRLVAAESPHNASVPGSRMIVLIGQNPPDL